VAARIADVLLNSLPAYGRAGSPRSHRWVICKEAVEKADECRRVTYKLPPSLADHPRLRSEHGMMVLEVRANGHYSMVPPSEHPNGEKVAADGNLLAPPQWSWPQIVQAGGLIAFLDVCTRLYPPLGTRHDFCMALTGALVRALMNSAEFKQFEDEGELVGHVDRIVQIVGDLAGGGKSHRQKFATNTLARLKSSGKVTGLKTVLKMLGIPDAELGRFAQWLGSVVHDERPKVLYDDMDTTKVVENVEAALHESGVNIFQQGGRLVHTMRLDQEEETAGFTRRGGSLLIRDVDVPRLHGYMLEHIRFTRLVIKKGKLTEVPGPPPRSLAVDFLAHVDKWRMRVLRGIIETPTLREDGTLIRDDGYDSASGLLLSKNGVEYPAIPDAPILDQCVVALKVLTDALDEFPFVDGPSLSVALSAIFTGLVRHLMSIAPMHGFDANSIGTGKSTLTDVVSIIVTGRRAGAMTLPSNEEESVKTWLSILSAGDRVVSIDDVERMRPVGGGTLNKILTQQTFKARLLGTNVEPEVPASVLILANGNNLTFAADTVSRAIVARMDAGVEDADRRSFKRDIYSYVPEHRAELVAAALTVLRGYWAAGRPFSAQESRFKEWDRLVRGALLWVGAADPMDTREAMEALDPVRTDRAALIEAMLRCFGKGTRVPTPTAQEIVDRAADEDDDGQALATALRPHMGKTAGNITSRSVTAYLKGQRDTITNGYRIRMLPGDGHHTVATFWVEEAKGRAKSPAASSQGEMAI
jgi:hypothetical protein